MEALLLLQNILQANFVNKIMNWQAMKLCADRMLQSIIIFIIIVNLNLVQETLFDTKLCSFPDTLYDSSWNNN